MTVSFNLAFKVGFVVSALDFLNTVFFKIRMRRKTELDKDGLRIVSEQTDREGMLYSVFDWTLRGILLLVSVF